jgi:hypothetical protein
METTPAIAVIEHNAMRVESGMAQSIAVPKVKKWKGKSEKYYKSGGNGALVGAHNGRSLTRAFARSRRQSAHRRRQNLLTV